MSALILDDVRLVRDGRVILDGINLDVQAGQVLALMGESGAGKSTTLRAVAALEPIAAGSIRIGDAVLHPGPLPPQSRLGAIRQQVGFVFQAHALFDHLSALDNVALALVHVHRWTAERANARAMELLRELGVDHRSHAMPRQLSGGEAQRVAIARALAADPAFLLMDEPTSALDPARRNALAETLRSLAAQGRGILIATHDMEFAQKCADHVLTLSSGRVQPAGT